MAVSIRPTGHRILVKPDTPPDTTDSGLILPEDRDHVPVSGIVAAMGPGGSLMRYQARQRAIHDCAEIIESLISTFGAVAPLTMARDEIAGRLGTSDPEHELHVWDRVVFPADVGLTVSEDGATYVLLNEDDVAAVAAEAEVAA